MVATIAQPEPSSRRLNGNLFAAASTIVWAAGFPAAGALLRTWDPLAAAAARLGLGAVALLAIWWLVEGVPRGFPWARGLLVGAVGFGGSALALVYAQAVADPVTVAVIASISPLTAAGVEWARDRRPLRPAFVWGLGASIAGGVVATAGGGAGGGSLALGAALTVLSCVVYSWGSDATVRSLPGRSGLALAAVTLAGAAGVGVAACAAGLALGWATLPAEVTARDAGLLAVYGLGGMAAAQVLFILSVQRIGVALASFYLNGAPFVVMLILWAAGGGWSWTQALGAAIVAGGVVLAQRR